MHKLTILLTSVFLLQTAFAKPHSPKTGSKERRDIMNALRKPVSHEAKTRPTFVVNYLKVDNEWAFAQVKAVDSNGKILGPDYMGGSIHALLRKTKNQWKVLVYGSATDTSIIEESKRKYPKAPKTIYNFG